MKTKKGSLIPRIGALLLSLCMLLGMIPASVFAEAKELKDENGVILNYEVTSSPQNGKHYVENEKITIDVYVMNDSSETLSNCVVRFKDNDVSVTELTSAAVSDRMEQSIVVSASDAEAGNLSAELSCSYDMNGQSYTDTLRTTLEFPTGPVVPEATGLSADGRDGILSVSFESNFQGTYAYACMNDKETAPDDWSGYERKDVTEGTNSFTVPEASLEWTKICVMLWDENDEPVQDSPIETVILWDSNDEPQEDTIDIKGEPAVLNAVIPLEDGFRALETTQIPYSSQVNLGGEETPIFSGIYPNSDRYAKLLKVEAEKGQTFELSFYGANDASIDTRILIYQEIGGTFTRLKTIDKDTVSGGGEHGFYNVTETGSYYLAFITFRTSDTGLFDLTVDFSDIMTLEDGLKTIETTQLPYSRQVDLGGEGTDIYNIDGVEWSAELLKVEAEKGQAINMSFCGVNNVYINTKIMIYQESGGTFQKLATINNNYGEDYCYIVPRTGTYGLAFLGFSRKVTGLCDLSVIRHDIKTLEEGFEILTETTDIPYSADVELGAEGAVLYYFGQDEAYAYASLIKADLKKDDILCMRFYSTEGSLCDTCIEVYQRTADGFERLYIFDDDTFVGDGESALYTVPSDGTYYLAFDGWDQYVKGRCRLEIDKFSQKDMITDRLDFTAEPVPVPAEDDLWSWDEGSKTLTLKDGFRLYNIDGKLNNLIMLPDGATVEVEGSAQIYNIGNGSIVSAGSLAICGSGKEASYLEIIYDGNNAIDTRGDMIVEECSLAVNAYKYALTSGGRITLRNAGLEMISGEMAVNSAKDVFITGCDISIPSSKYAVVGTAVQAENSRISAGSVNNLINAGFNVYLTSCDVSAAETLAGIVSLNGEVVIDGGSFSVAFIGGGIGGNSLKVVFKGDLKLDLRGLENDSQLLHATSMEVSLEGDIRLYDGNGNMIYEGPWEPELFDENQYSVAVDGVLATRMENLHRHIYDRKVDTDEYLVAAANCTEPARYYYSCECGEKGTETFESGKALGHNYKNGVCTVCGAADPDYVPGFTPEIIEGANGTWQKGGKDGLSFTSNAEFADFIKVQVDGKDLDASDYTVREGSTIVTLKADYLGTLSVGEHTLFVVSANGTAVTKFTIAAAQTGGSGQTGTDQTGSGNQTGADQTGTLSPKTGDSNSLMFWIVLMILSGGVLTAVIFRERKK